MKRISFFIFFVCFALTAFAQGTRYVIQKGETLYSIARRFDTSVEAICLENGITDATKIEVNQVLTIPLQSDSAAEEGAFTASRASESKTTTYTVLRGDTIYGLARKFSIDVNSILSANGMTDKDVLKVGQSVIIPEKAAKPSAVKTKVAKPVPAPQIKPTDPREINEKKVDPNVIWPIKATAVNYVSGKVNSVLLTSKQKEDVKAIKGGIVIFSGLYRGFGQVVFVHSQKTGHIYVYGGLETVTVKKGQNVIFGDKIGSIGVDSITGKPTLNFMVFKNGEPEDPVKAPRG